MAQGTKNNDLSGLTLLGKPTKPLRKLENISESPCQLPLCLITLQPKNLPVLSQDWVSGILPNENFNISRIRKLSS